MEDVKRFVISNNRNFILYNTTEIVLLIAVTRVGEIVFERLENLCLVKTLTDKNTKEEIRKKWKKKKKHLVASKFFKDFKVLHTIAVNIS